jgi:hypothetical protein
MFGPHIYGCQSFISGSASNPTIQSPSMIDDSQFKNPSPQASPQKNRHSNSNTVIPIQSAGGNETPQRKQSNQENENASLLIASNVENVNNVLVQQHLNVNDSGGSSNSGENSRKTSTISNYASSECTPENTILTPKQMHSNDIAKQSPVRKLSRFLVSPTVIETSNKELIVQEDVMQQQIQQQQQQQNTDLEMNINDESYQKTVELQAPESELQPQQSIGFKMPETLEQLKIELENITHAHVLTKTKEVIISTQTSSSIQNVENQDDNSNMEQMSEAQIENSNEITGADQVGSLTGENTSVYNSRRTSADMNTNQTDLISTASGVLDYDESVANELNDDTMQRPLVHSNEP